MSHIMEQQQLHHTPPQGQQGQGQQGQVQPHQALYRPQQHQQLMGMTQVQQQQMMQQGVQYLTMTQGAEGGAANLTGPNGQQVIHPIQSLCWCVVWSPLNEQCAYYHLHSVSYLALFSFLYHFLCRLFLILPFPFPLHPTHTSLLCPSAARLLRAAASVPGPERTARLLQSWCVLTPLIDMCPCLCVQHLEAVNIGSRFLDLNLLLLSSGVVSPTRTSSRAW